MIWAILNKGNCKWAFIKAEAPFWKGEVQVGFLLFNITIGWQKKDFFGTGDYSCATCGLGMKEPCEHWKTILSQPDRFCRDCGTRESSEQIKYDRDCQCGGTFVEVPDGI